MTYTVVVHKADPDETGFWAEVPELPGCFTQGETLDEIRLNVVDAIEAWWEAAARRGGDLPAPVEFKFEVDVPNAARSYAEA